MLRLVPLTALVVVLGACGAERDDGSGAPSVAAASASSDAMCEEHGVLQVLCTRCNPALAPVFQARGDWCEEHEYPESICPLCHPERGGRPQVAVGEVPTVPAEGDVLFLRDQRSAALAGIETGEVLARSEPVSIVAPGRLAYDARRRAVVNARAPGVIVAVHAELGQQVAAGDPLVSIESAEAGELRARLVSARERAQVAESAFERTTTLRSEGISSERSLQGAGAERAAARSEVASIETALRMLGRSAGRSRYIIAAPIAGTVVSRAATIGHLADVDDVLFELVDVTQLWAEAEVPEEHSGALAPGRAMTLSFDALPERTVEVTVDFVAPEVDPHSRTVLARAQVPNVDGRLRANLLLDARVEIAPARDGIFVPRSAVQHARGHDFVFVPGEAPAYEVRRVRPIARVGDLVEVEGRLAAGDRVVTEGAFLLLAEALPNALGAGCCAE